MFTNFNSIVSSQNRNSLSFPTASRMFINSKGIQTDGGQVTLTTPANVFQKASTIMSSSPVQLFPGLNAVQDGLNVQGSVLGVLPGKPSITGVSNATAPNIVITFTAPSNSGGSPITGYKAYAYTADNGTLVNPTGVSGNSPSITYTGLIPGTVYTFKVSAINGTGEGPLSDASSPVMVAPVQNAPVLTSVTSGAATQLTLSISSSPSPFISNYEYTTDNGSTWRTAGTASSPFNITLQSDGTALVANTSYNVLVREKATISYFFGFFTYTFYSNASNSLTGITLPGPPTLNNVTTTPSTIRSLNVTYTPAAGGAASSVYQYTTNGGSNWASLGASTFNITLQSWGSSFADNTVYTVAVRANNTASQGTYNAGGTSASSGSLSGTTLPGAPTSFNVSTPLISQTLSLSFTAPSGTATITDYEYSTNNGSAWLSRGTISTSFNITAQSVSPYNVLVNGTTYPVKLRAVNAGGAGTATAAVNGTPANPIPQATYTINSVSSTSYPSQASVPSLGAVWRDVAGSAFQSTLEATSGLSGFSWSTVQSPATSGFPNYAYFNMGNVNANWKFTIPGYLSLNNSSKSISIWSMPRYSFPNGSQTTAALLYKFNNESGTLSPNYLYYSGYGIIGGPTPLGTSEPSTFNLVVRTANYTSPSVNNVGANVLTSTSSATYAKNVWYMLTLVAENVGTANANFYLYIDDNSTPICSILNADTSSYDDLGTDSPNNTTLGGYITNYTKVGSGALDGWQYGQISTLSQYNTALSSTDIAAIYNSQKGSYPGK